ncbi:MAG TPA: ChbG/HpnK family deacetylase [Vicinamibacterales bacterium]|jgi:predicted glycoside hydrolase/deacetylase ChbG (UPF0249 family)
MSLADLTTATQPRSNAGLSGGVLVINADDWGRDRDTTERTLECIRAGSVSSVSAMVFMEDSERAAAIAREQRVDAGLHLNFTTPFAPGAPTGLVEHQRRLAQYLRRHRFAAAVFHPGLSRSFEYVIASQLEEFRRLYGATPDRLDGHHHMHLCMNVVLRNLLPAGTLVRRNFSFRAGEKWIGNRTYRSLVDAVLRRRHDVMDFLFTLPPFEPRERLQRIFSLARQFAVELETHPIDPDEYRFLIGGELRRWSGDLAVAPDFAAGRPKRRHPQTH